MLRRNCSKRKKRHPLGRSKSTSSVHRNPVLELQSIDPIVAERDAHIAAVLSYSRAQKTYTHDMAFLRSQSHVVASSMYDVANNTDTRCESQCSGRTDRVEHQRSVRFTDSSGRPRRMHRLDANDDYGIVADGPRRQHDNITSLEQPGSRLSRDLESSMHLAATASPRTLINPEDHHKRQESVTSGLFNRKLRRSKSMFTSFEHLDKPYTHASSPSEISNWLSSSPRANKKSRSIAKNGAMTLRTPKSMSFLRSRRNIASSTLTGSSCVASEEAIKLAREKFHQQTDQGQLGSQPMSFSQYRARRTDNSIIFQKSLRSSSNNSTAISSAISSNMTPAPGRGSLRISARKVSRTIKAKFKDIFGRTNSSSINGSYEGEQFTLTESDAESCNHVHRSSVAEDIGDASMSRGPSRMTSLHDIPVDHHERSERGSLVSCEDDASLASEEKSRVTSWADSLSNVGGFHSSSEDWDRQRLSIIQENGTNTSNLAICPSRVGDEDTPRQLTAINSNRMYSALMERMKEYQNPENSTKNQSFGSFMPNENFPLRTSAFEQARGEEWSPCTIRHVTSDDDVFLDQKGLRKPRRSYSLESTPRQAANSTSSLRLDHATRSEGQDSEATSNLKSSRSLSRSTTLTLRSSAFFSSPPSHLFRTTSPFRRALKANMRAIERDLNKGILCKTENECTDTLAAQATMSSPTVECPHDPASSYSDSIYSPQSGDSRGPVAESMTGIFDQSPSLEVQEPWTRSMVSDARSQHGCNQRDLSVASSVEWKKWLSADVSNMERVCHSPWNDGTFNGSRESVKLGHLREDTEIESPGEVTELISQQAPAGTPVKFTVRDVRQGSAHTSVPRVKSSLPSNENTAPATLVINNTVLSTKSPHSIHSLPINTQLNNLGNVNGMTESKSLSSILKTSYHPRDSLNMKRRARMKRGKEMESMVQSSPTLSAAMERHFATTLTGSPQQKGKIGDIQTPPKLLSRSCSRSRIHNGSESPQIKSISPSGKADIVKTGSRTMVDLFLSSRRSRGECSDDKAARSSPAFL
jgi:hypothetical protein